MNIFFALSGFLITSLLLQERIATGRVRFRNFYISRALRLYPALVALIAVISIYSLFAPFAIREEQSLAGTIPALFYFANWVRAFGTNGSLGMYEHTWSLSIEEQFYFLWPLVLWVIFKVAKKLWVVLVVSLAGCLGSLALRLVLAPGQEGLPRIYNGLDTQADQLLFGCAVGAGVMWAASAGTSAILRRGLAIGVWPAIVGLLAAALWWPHHGVTPAIRVAITFVGIGAAIIVGHLYLSPQSALSRVFALRPLRFVGQRSYSLYLWHYPIFTALFAADLRYKVFLLVAFGASFVAAELSYRYVERPFRSLKKRHSERQDELDLSANSMQLRAVPGDQLTRTYDQPDGAMK